MSLDNQLSKLDDSDSTVEESDNDTDTVSSGSVDSRTPTTTRPSRTPRRQTPTALISIARLNTKARPAVPAAPRPKTPRAWVPLESSQIRRATPQMRTARHI